MYTILITGINGFLGSHIAKRLSTEHRIIGLVHSKQNLFRLNDFDFEIYLSDDKSIETLFAEHHIDILIHTATYYGRNNEDVNKIFATNFLLPYNLLNKCIENGSSHFINTDTVLDRFVNTYALTKRQFQEWLYFRSGEINAINMQLEHFYGEGCSSTNFITAMGEKLKSNEPQIDLTAGEQLRDFIHYSDVVDAYELIINKLDKIEGKYNNYEVSNGELITIKDLMCMLKAITKSTTTLNFGAVPYRENELMKSKTNNEKLRALGWIPKTSINDGLKLTII